VVKLTPATVLKELDRLLLSVLFVVMVVIATSAPSERVFDLAADCATGILGALIVLMTQRQAKQDSNPRTGGI
jgi:hypothetical protein